MLKTWQNGAEVYMKALSRHQRSLDLSHECVYKWRLASTLELTLKGRDCVSREKVAGAACAPDQLYPS